MSVQKRVTHLGVVDEQRSVFVRKPHEVRVKELQEEEPGVHASVHLHLGYWYRPSWNT